MVFLGIGIKVATLPVIALGVGIGVDYALYILGIVIKQLRAGATLSQAYHRTLLFTGKVVVLTGFTLAAGVVTWAFAPIKFQADMGLLLSFMFLWNMLGGCSGANIRAVLIQTVWSLLMKHGPRRTWRRCAAGVRMAKGWPPKCPMGTGKP